jgi:putative membrane protein
MNNKDSREYLANERTFMAWIRTGIAIMAFGFVVAKFSLFIRQLGLITQTNNLTFIHKGYSSFVGLIILCIGAMIIPVAYYRYKQVNAQITYGNFSENYFLPTALTLMIAIVSLSLIVYLIATSII